MSRWEARDITRVMRDWWKGADFAGLQAVEDELHQTPKSEWDAFAGFVVQDRRDVLRKDKHKRGRRKGERTWDEITGICLHQTASPVGHDHPNLLGIPAHGHVSQEGVITLLQPATAYMWHGHSLNRFTIGIELEARAARIEGDLSTLWMSRREKRAGKTPDKLVREATDKQLHALDALIHYYILLHRRNASPSARAVTTKGGAVTGWKAQQPLGLYAHRQGHKSRTSDPGSRIARHVWEGWCLGSWSAQRPGKRAYLLRDTTNESHGSGRPWPESWKT